MLERWTAFLAQAAATVVVLIGLIVLLSYTHMSSYRAGYCANNACTSEGDGRWRPFGNDEATEPVRELQAVPRSSSQPIQNATAVLPDSQSGSQSGSRQQPDPPPSVGSRDPNGESGSLPVTDTVRGVRSGSRPAGTARSTAYYATPGEEICYGTGDASNDAAIARCWLRIGDAYQAIGQIEYARVAWNEALLVGSEVGGAQASLTAHQRLQSAVLARSCRTTDDSLRRIANGFDRQDVNGEIISLRLRQNALSALGYYADSVDGEYGPNTRRAVRDFQADMGFDQTGALNPQETVDLVCHAAVTARDPGAQNLLGIMFATGLGVELNVDMATEWFEIAATRGHPEANFNLALIYGTGTVQGSYRLCGVVESPERADSYLRRAAELGHTRAEALRAREGRGGNPSGRWDRIASRLLEEAEQSGDRFYLAWQRRLEEAERLAVDGAIQPGCYLESVEDRYRESSGAL